MHGEPPFECVINVEEDSTAVVTALLALGAAAFLIALLGVRFTSIKVGSFEAQGAGASEQMRSAIQNDVDSRKLRPVAAAFAGGSSIDLWSRLPAWVQSALIRWIAEKPVIDLPIDQAVIGAYKPTSAGNIAWSVELQAADGVRALRVSPAASFEKR